MNNSNFVSVQLAKQDSRRIDLYTKDATNVHSFFKENCNCVVYTFERKKNGIKQLLALGFQGRSNKKSFFIRFQTIDRRKEYIETFFKKILIRFENELERKKEVQKLKIKMADSIEVGTICQGSWGYEQTNREFFQVIAKPSKFKVKVKAIGYKVIPNSQGHDSDYVTPVRNDFFGKEQTKLITQYGIKVHRNCTVTPCDENDKYYRSWGY